MPPRLRSRIYAGEEIAVSYDIRRCIHAEECVRRLSAVFDKDKRPWILPDEAAPDQVAATVVACPTGALHYERTDGGHPEVTPESNLIQVAADGALYVRGDVRITDPDGTILFQDTRIALCRCGASKNKPFCDNTHRVIQFKAGETLAGKHTPVESKPAKGGPLTITPWKDGSYGLAGEFKLVNSKGEVLFQGDEAYLCRCGKSGDKPFCDRTHREIGFQADMW